MLTSSTAMRHSVPWNLYFSCITRITLVLCTCCATSTILQDDMTGLFWFWCYLFLKCQIASWTFPPVKVIYSVENPVYHFLKILGSSSILVFSQVGIIKMMSKRNYKQKVYWKFPGEWLISADSLAQSG